MRFMHLALHLLLTGAFVISVHKTSEAKSKEIHAWREKDAITLELNDLIRVRDTLLQERSDLKSQIENANSEMSRLGDMLAFHLRACR